MSPLPRSRGRARSLTACAGPPKAPFNASPAGSCKKARPWVAEGDAMEAAIHSWSLRVGCGPTPELPVQLRLAYTADRMLSSVVIAERSIVLGAPEAVLGRCLGAVPHDVVDDLAERGRRVLAVAEGAWHPGEPESKAETGLTLLALIGFEDPPRPDVAEALAACRSADIKVAMITGDHPGTAAAVAREVGLLGRAWDCAGCKPATASTTRSWPPAWTARTVPLSLVSRLDRSFASLACCGDAATSSL